jgi:PPK2 family polyphosphate:nucleotide phosphotransferase
MKLLVDTYRIQRGQKDKFGQIRTHDTGPFKAGKLGKEEARDLFKKQQKRLSELQERLYADGKQALLVIFQAMDAGGKDGCIANVVGSFDPQGVNVSSFKAPTAQELAHDFLWRIHQKTPAKGMIGVFNRSHYEDVLVVRVKELVPETVWSKRYELINAFERTLSEAGTQIVKVYLHIDKNMQKKRLQERLDDPTKQWKLSPSDLKEREKWDDYMTAFGAVFEQCSEIPWYVVPANYKWYRDVVVAQILIETLEKMNLTYPGLEYDPKTVVIK